MRRQNKKYARESCVYNTPEEAVEISGKKKSEVSLRRVVLKLYDFFDEPVPGKTVSGSLPSLLLTWLLASLSPSLEESSLYLYEGAGPGLFDFLTGCLGRS